MAEKQFKPFLGVTAEKDKIKFPAMASLKLDGIRCVCMNGELLSRALKPIRNVQLQEKFREMMNFSKEYDVIFDGEFYCHDMTFQEITSEVNSMDKEVSEGLKFHCFDFIKGEDFDMKFKDRNYLLEANDVAHIVYVEQIIINTVEDVDKMFEKALKEDYEGIIIRNPDFKYKKGRSTVNEGGMLKVKPWETFDCKISGVVERMENLNESHKNELGQSFKRNTKEDKKGTGIASCFSIEYFNEEGERVKVNGEDPRVTLTGEESFRRDIWENRDSYIGKMIEFKGMVVGALNSPRHPTFLRFREDRD